MLRRLEQNSGFPSREVPNHTSRGRAYLVVYVTTGASPGESTTNHVNRVSPLSYHTFGDISISMSV